MTKIVTEFIYPPIPLRQFDWCAHYDDPEGPTGWGRTEQEARADLLANHPPPCPDCDGNGGLTWMGIWCECANCDGSGEQPANDPFAAHNLQ